MRPIEAALVLFEMRKNQWLCREELESLQLRKLKALLSYASKKVQHYRSLSGSQMRDISDISTLPILSKKSVRQDPDSFISMDYPRERLLQTSTSGSSGFQVPLFTSGREGAFGIAFECHHLFENGIGPFDKQAKITHFVSAPNAFQKMGIMSCNYISVLKGEDQILRELRSGNPDVLCTYPSILRSLALSSENTKLKMIFTGGELLHPDVRALAERSFGCPVRDRYGSMESSWVAWECEKGSYHLHSDQAILEVVDENGMVLPEGRVGRIIVTPLWRLAMPFIRYDIGDKGAIGGKCSCGRGLHVIRQIEGRDDDSIILPSGRIRSARAINLMDDIEDVLSYQIIQEAPDLFVFRYVPSGKDLHQNVRAEIARRIRSGCLGESIRVEFEQVDRIIRGRTGKIRAVISKVRHHA